MIEGTCVDCEPGSSVTVRGSARTSPGATVVQMIGSSIAAHFNRASLSHTSEVCRMLQALARVAPG
jgi:hypothetical protein